MGKEEGKVEGYLNDEVRKLGGFTRKFQYVGRRGGADRIVFLFGHIYLVEVKTDTGEESVLQTRERQRIQQAGCEAHVVFGKGGVARWLQRVTDLPTR